MASHHQGHIRALSTVASVAQAINSHQGHLSRRGTGRVSVQNHHHPTWPGDPGQEGTSCDVIFWNPRVTRGALVHVGSTPNSILFNRREVQQGSSAMRAQLAPSQFPLKAPMESTTLPSSPPARDGKWVKHPVFPSPVTYQANMLLPCLTKKIMPE